MTIIGKFEIENNFENKINCKLLNQKKNNCTTRLNQCHVFFLSGIQRNKLN